MVQMILLGGVIILTIVVSYLLWQIKILRDVLSDESRCRLRDVIYLDEKIDKCKDYCKRRRNDNI